MPWAQESSAGLISVVREVFKIAAQDIPKKKQVQVNKHFPFIF